MNRTKRYGLFAVLEGIDGSGKTSVCKTVSEKLARDGFDTIITTEPTHDEIGTFIRNGAVANITPETEALLFVADRAQHTFKINAWKASGKIVICDRYYASTLAYQSAPLDGKSVDAEWLKELNRPIITEPDVTILIDISIESSLERAGSRGALSKFERPEYLEVVRNNYLTIAKERSFTIVHGERSLKDVADEVYKIIKKTMEK